MVNKITKIAFDEALSQLSNSNENVANGAIERLFSLFEQAAHHSDGFEFWYARELQVLLAYATWENFSKVVDKSKVACKTSGYEASDHFLDVTKVIEAGKGAQHTINDIKLTRYACYLIAQNGNSRKPPVAFAQTYFAIQTRRQEIASADENNYESLLEGQKRVLLRNEMKEHNKQLASAAKKAGVVQPLEHAVFTNYGYKGLYGGLDRAGIQKRKGLSLKDNILDHMGSTELAANLFRATQAEEKLKRENIKGKDNANKAHLEVGQKVRQAIKDIGGTMPEQLPTAENIVKVEKQLQKINHKKLKE